MKFTKEDAVKELSAKITALGEDSAKWQRTLTESVDTLFGMFDDDNLELADFADKAFPLFKTTAGFVRSVTSKAVKENEEKVRKELETTKPKDTKPDKSGDTELEQLQNRIKALEEQDALRKQTATIETNKQGILAKLKEKGLTDEDWAKSAIGLAHIKEDTDIEATSASLLELYNKGKEGKPTTPLATPKPPQPDKNMFADVAASVKAKTDENK